MSEEDPVYIVLDSGNYYLHEASTPDPEVYGLAKDVYFSVDADGTISSGETVIEIVSMIDPYVKDIEVIKKWDDKNDKDKLRPTEIMVQLYADEEAVGEPVILSEENSWTYIWENMNCTVNGEKITYTVKELEIPRGYKAKVETKDETVFTITNTHKPDEAPKTGDSSHTRDYAIISSLSALGLAYLFICLNKRKKLQK
ncbi:MAG: Cna B-type domain-containing protein, partial [Erysipelotrichaceae bacterium]|nr:Cna B-type domain-containing protein [Erysipelotrichaceae bacterium]